MKKQILFLVLFIMATFANVNKSYGQCTPDALHPAPNVEYDYSVAISGDTFAGTGTFYWYITQSPNVITATGTPAAAMAEGPNFNVTGGSAYATTTGTSNSISITWTPAAIAAAATDPFYLVLWYAENNTAGTAVCNTDNVRAWQIKPINSFLLAITGVADDLTTLQSEECVAPVETAVITEGPTDNSDASINVTYGENTLYFDILASGVDGTFRPHFRIPALAGNQVYTSLHYSIDDGGNWISLGTAAGDIQGTTPAPVTVAGDHIILRAVIDNVNYETTTIQPLIFAVDGFLPTDFSVSDIKSASDCTPEDAFGKSTTYNILPRPTLTGTPGFMTKNP